MLTNMIFSRFKANMYKSKNKTYFKEMPINPKNSDSADTWFCVHYMPLVIKIWA